ncbi:MAG: hypothetical protein INR73_24825 [Williamsia sp.]|nr:hypothetical protein [Williamsia sp.]
MTIKSCLTCIFLCATCTIRAQSSALRQADSLFRQGAYFEASVGYERVLFEDNNPETALHAITQKIQCLKQQGLFTQAVNFIRTNLHENLPDSTGYRLYYEQTLCTYLAGNYENALSVVEQAKLLYPTRSEEPRLKLLQLLSLNELQRWEEAGHVYNAFVGRYGVADTALSPYKHLPHLKSKDKAQWLSTFIPGAGQIYAGKPLEALVTIGMQGAGIWFGIVSFQQHYYLAAWLAGAGLFGSFHMGGVRRSEVLVEQYNRKKITQFNEQVKSAVLKMMAERQ